MMMSPIAEYAISALGYLAAAPEKALLVRDISAAQNIPAPYLAKIVNVLARKGFVVTRRGIGGGVRLARPAESITLQEVCVALDGTAKDRCCLRRNEKCSPMRACPAHPFCSVHRAQCTEFLRQTTLRDIAQFEARQTIMTASDRQGGEE